MAQQQPEHPSNLVNTNNLLQAATDCASALLSDDDFERGVNRALEILGTSVDAERLGIGEHIEDITGKTIGHLIVHPYEWLSSYAASQFAHSEMKIIPYDGIEELYEQLKVGQHWGGSIENFPEPFRSNQQEKLGVKATYSIPITIDGEYWGLIGLDFCQTSRELSDAEIAVLKTTATCIGSAIQRERNRRAKEEAERNILLERKQAAQERAIQLQEHNRVLEQRDRILSATAEASNVLLAEDDFDEAVNRALQIVGESIDTDRIVIVEIFENPSDPSYLYWKITYEWDSACTVSQSSHPEVFQGSWEGIEEWYELFNKGQTISCQLEEIPEPFLSLQAKLGVKTFNSVPIFIEGKYWGNVSVDDCREETHRSEAELSILKTAAASIGGAIERERTRRAKEEAERQILLEREQAAQKRAIELAEHNRVLEQRDRILAATAEASNVLLTGADFDEAVNRALRIIGETIDTDRVAVVENFKNPSELLHLCWKITYEWDSAYAIPQIERPEIAQGSYEGIEEWYELWSKGQTVCCQLEEMPEPFRSSMAKIGVKTMNNVPIFIEGKYWGNIGIDDCREETYRSEAELSILKTAAACIGGAIERERTRRAKEEAERNILLEREQAAQERAKLLQAVATVANSLLRSPDYHTALPEVLQILGEAAKSDRCGLVQNVPDPVTGKAAVKLHTEWCREGITKSVESTPELETALLWEYFPQFQEKLTQGEISSFLVEELSEPARSILQAQGNVSMTLVPIMVQGEFWGVFGFDYCQEARIFEEENTAVFTIAVDSIAAAIERERQDEALKASEKRYRTLFELSNEGIYRFEIDSPIDTSLPIEEQVDLALQHYRFAEANEAYYAQIGVSNMEELVQFTLRDFHSDLEQNRQVNLAIIQNGYQIRNAETEETDALGRRKFFLNNIVCDLREGLFLGGWCMQTDITELKQAQQALLEAERERARELEALNAKLQQALEELAESEKRYRTLFELSNEGIYRFEFDKPISTSLSVEEQLRLIYQHYRIAEVNSAFIGQYGFSSIDEVIGKGLTDFYLEDSEISLAMNRAVIENDYQVRNTETEEIDANRQTRYFLQNVVGNVRDGYLWGGWGTQTDITELKEAQQALLEAERKRVAQLEESNQILSLRDRWLEATALAANQLLATPDLDAGINAALKMLGESLDCDRVCVAQWFEDSTEETCGFIHLLYEWDSQYASRQILHPELKKITYAKEHEDMVVSLKQGGFVGGTIEQFPDESFQIEQIELEVKSTYGVGIFVGGRLWGVLGIDYCREPRRLTLPEIAVFKTAASCVGSAIYRQQIQQEKEEAERQRVAQLEQSNQVLSLRDRWLEATALAANRLLATPDLDAGINAALKMLGESLDCDRIGIVQYIRNNTGESLSFMRALYEWNSKSVVPQIFHSELNKISDEGMKEYFARIQVEEWIGGLIEEYPEPFRSRQIELGVKSTYAVPIFVNEKFWGILGIDFCREAKRLTLPEIAVFKTAASCVGSAIYRQQMIEEQKEAERAVLEERNHLAREIHDTIGQSFTAIVMQLEAGKRLLTAKPDRVSSCLNLAQDLAHQGITQVQRSLWTLRENADEYNDLVAAFQKLVTTLNTNVPVRIKFSSSGTQSPLSPHISLNLLRIGQEAVTNALKHAEARHIDLNLAFNSDRIQLQIRDDGRGFAPELLAVNSGFGVRSIEQRAEQINAVVNIITNPGNGTAITVTVPLTII